MYVRLDQYLQRRLAKVYEVSGPAAPVSHGLPNSALTFKFKTLETAFDDSVLLVYLDEWDRYGGSRKYINFIFRYLTAHWVQREIREGKKNVYAVHTVRRFPRIYMPTVSVLMPLLSWYSFDGKKKYFNL